MGNRFAIISDLHANLEAMQAVYRVIDNEGIDEIVCLGDIVGYNADPKALVNLTRERCKAAIRGNHDRYVLGETATDVKETKAEVIDWTRSQLPPTDLEWLRSLEDAMVWEGDFILSHGSPRDMDEYILSSDVIQGNLRHMRDTYIGVDVAFFGHSHFPMVIGGGKVEQKFHGDSTTVELDRNKTYLINPGSVGQPRDRSPKAAFGIFDRDAWTMTIRRVPYDIKSAQKKIRDAQIDVSHAIRLQHGK